MFRAFSFLAFFFSLSQLCRSFRKIFLQTWQENFNSLSGQLPANPNGSPHYDPNKFYAERKREGRRGGEISFPLCCDNFVLIFLIADLST